MKITALVENRSRDGLATVHGLSLHIETARHRILFDLGPDGTLFKNAAARGIDLTKVDAVILSHGHKDHGGALKQFLAINSTAKVYVQRSAFEPHYGRVLFIRASVSLDAALMTHPQVVLLDGDTHIDDELFLFTVSNADKCWSPANDILLDRNGPDRFLHEQNLIVRDASGTALVMGCGHTGIVNIMEKAALFAPQVCIGGYHLSSPVTGKPVGTALLDEIADALEQYPDTQFHTCHCTGEKAYCYLAARLPNLHYLSCGEEVAL